MVASKQAGLKLVYDLLVGKAGVPKKLCSPKGLVVHAQPIGEVNYLFWRKVCLSKLGQHRIVFLCHGVTIHKEKKAQSIMPHATPAKRL